MKNTVKKLRHKAIILIFLFIFFLSQAYNIIQIGSTPDELGIQDGNRIVFEKTFNNNILQSKSINKNETYGQFISLQQYIFSNFNFTNSIFKKITELITNENIDSFLSRVISLRFIYFNFYSIFIIFIIWMFIQKIYSIRFSLIFLIFFLLTPSVSGHMLFNQKDIGFMLHLFLFNLSFYYFYKQKNNFKIYLFLGILFGITINLRPVGLAFLIFFICSLNVRDIILDNFSSFKLKTSIYTPLLGILFFIIISPSSWFDFKNYFVVLLNQQILLDWTGSTLTNGKFVLAQEMKSSYLIIWFFYKLPIIYHFFMIIFIIYIFKYEKLKNVDFFTIFNFLFLLVVFTAFSIIKPNVYDGIRQFLFLIPSFLINVAFILDKISSTKIFGITLCLSIFYLFFTQFGLSEYKYIYLNEFIDEENIQSECDNVDGCGNWLLDYWGLSGKALSNKINSHRIGNVNICKGELFLPYLDESLLPNYVDENFKYVPNINNRYYFATIYRPRYNSDSCMLYLNSERYNCKTLFTIESKMRKNKLNLAFIKECEVNF